MRIRVGYNIAFENSIEAPSILMLSIHPSREKDLMQPNDIKFDPVIPVQTYMDHFGNICTRIVMPPGMLAVSAENIVHDSGAPDLAAPGAGQIPIQDLPPETLEFHLGSRYCETDRLSDTAWSIFGNLRPGWERVQAICDYVHDRLTNTHLAYLMGIVSGITWHDAELWSRERKKSIPNVRVICPPEEMMLTADQEVNILTYYVAKHPSVETRSLDSVMLYALEDAFPCE
jgi:hypothetical protein